MEFTQCPYDGSPIVSGAFSNEATLLSCAVCGAAWEWHNKWLRRIREPDRDALREARVENQPRQVARGNPEPAFLAAMWRQVRSPSASSSSRSKKTPPES